MVAAPDRRGRTTKDKSNARTDRPLVGWSAIAETLFRNGKLPTATDGIINPEHIGEAARKFHAKQVEEGLEKWQGLQGHIIDERMKTTLEEAKGETTEEKVKLLQQSSMHKWREYGYASIALKTKLLEVQQAQEAKAESMKTLHETYEQIKIAKDILEKTNKAQQEAERDAKKSKKRKRAYDEKAATSKAEVERLQRRHLDIEKKAELNREALKLQQMKLDQASARLHQVQSRSDFAAKVIGTTESAQPPPAEGPATDAAEPVIQDVAAAPPASRYSPRAKAAVDAATLAKKTQDEVAEYIKQGYTCYRCPTHGPSWHKFESDFRTCDSCKQVMPADPVDNTLRVPTLGEFEADYEGPANPPCSFQTSDDETASETDADL